LRPAYIYYVHIVVESISKGLLSSRSFLHFQDRRNKFSDTGFV